jgi:hypothetical protein
MLHALLTSSRCGCLDPLALAFLGYDLVAPLDAVETDA